MSDYVMTPAELADVGRSQRMLPTEADFKGRKGYWQRPKMVTDAAGQRVPDPSGAYDWGFRYTPNVGGKKTREQHEVEERMGPYSRASVERSMRRNTAAGTARMRDGDGGLHTVPAARAAEAAARNGWSHHARVRGLAPVASGPEGMLWRPCADGTWEPTGVRSLGQPLFGSRHVPRRGVQHDPSGRPWRWVARAWRPCA